MSFGDRLAALRNARGISQAELAKKIGVSQGAIGNYESGSSPKQNIADKLAEYFNVPVEDLVNGRALTPAERDLFLQAAPLVGQAGLFHLVIYYTGLRPSEASRIEARDVNMKTRTLTVRGTKTKAAARQVPIPKALDLPSFSGKLFSTTHGCTPTKTARALWWKKVASKMEELSGEPVAPDLVPYDLRHDYCTRLCEKEVPIEIASKLMGHSSIALTAEIYQHATPETLDLARTLIDA